jgi:hypothetical protein
MGPFLACSVAAGPAAISKPPVQALARWERRAAHLGTSPPDAWAAEHGPVDACSHGAVDAGGER